MMNGIQIFAEVKIKSPFGFKSTKSWGELFAVANEIGDVLSIHTDRRWAGSFNLIKMARSMTKKPILAKGFHATDSDIVKAVRAGADLVLVVGRIPKVHLDKCLIEPTSLENLKEIPVHFKLVWNSRDLTTGHPKKETYEQARALWPGWLCQASNIVTVKDVKKDAQAVLVGTHLEEFAKSLPLSSKKTQKTAEKGLKA